MPCKNCTCKSCVNHSETKLNILTYDKLNLDLERNPMILYCSGRNSGKSFSIQNLVYEMLKKKKYDIIYVFSNTAQISHMDKSYEFVNKHFIFRSNEMDKTVTQIINSQMKLKDKGLSLLLIFDDIIIEQTPVLNLLATQGRHYGITVIISSQKASTLISSQIRSNFDYLFWRKINTEDIKDFIYSMLSNTDHTSKEIVELTHNNTDDYKFLMYDNTIDSKDNIVCVKAKKVKFVFRIKNFNLNDKKKNIDT